MVASMGMPGMFGGGGLNAYGGNWMGMAGMPGMAQAGGGGQVPPPWASMLGGPGQTMPNYGYASNPPPGVGQAQPGMNMPPMNSPWANATNGISSADALAQLSTNPDFLASLNHSGVPSPAQPGRGMPQIPPQLLAMLQARQAGQAGQGMPPGAQGMGGFGMMGMPGGLGNMLAGSMPRGRGPAARPPVPARQPRRATYGGGSAGNISLSGY